MPQPVSSLNTGLHQVHWIRSISASSNPLEIVLPCAAPEPAHSSNHHHATLGLTSLPSPDTTTVPSHSHCRSSMHWLASKDTALHWYRSMVLTGRRFSQSSAGLELVWSNRQFLNPNTQYVLPHQPDYGKLTNSHPSALVQFQREGKSDSKI